MSKIWYQDNLTLEMLNERGRGTLVEHLGIAVTEIGDDYMVATMPVDHKTKQPNNILNGGASAALVESLASTAGNCCVDQEKQYCVGVEINANHLRSTSDGVVSAKAWPYHIGRTTHVWGVEITQNGKKICVARMTLLLRGRKKPCPVESEPTS